MKQLKNALTQEPTIYFLIKVFPNISEKLETRQIYNMREMHKLLRSA